jgi:hypothetical protein
LIEAKRPGKRVADSSSNDVYPLVNVYITMENHNFQRENPCKWPFSIAMFVYQRVSQQSDSN